MKLHKNIPESAIKIYYDGNNFINNHYTKKLYNNVDILYVYLCCLNEGQK